MIRAEQDEPSVLETADLTTVLVACGVAAGVAFGVGLVLTVAVRWFAKRTDLEVAWTRLWRSPIVLLFVAIAVRSILASSERQRDWAETVVHVLDVVVICTIGWMLVVVTQLIETAALRKHPATGLEDRRSRHERTKISLLHKVANAVIITGVVIAVLWTIPSVRQVGVGLLASAGVVGIVFGLAAQTSLSNLFAGVQIAFTDAIRMDDIVDIDGLWGRIEEITLTYVVVRVWDGTSLILPCTYFTTTPFRNWTHQGTATSGTVEIGVDWNVPVDDLRSELARILSSSPHWDGEKGELHVDDASGPVVRLVAVVSARDGDALNALRWEVREALVAHLHREHSTSLPREQLVARIVSDGGRPLDVTPSERDGDDDEDPT